MKLLKDQRIDNDGSRENKITMALLLGAFFLSKSKRIMNNIVIAIDGVKDDIVYSTDTASVYKENKRGKT